jgi:hypothetical protein
MASKNIDTLTYGARSYYPSNINGMRILNAVTGIAYDDLVGSKEEVNYFRVLDSTGKFNNNGYKLPQGCYNPSTNKLYYDNREEWMRHINFLNFFLR